MENDRLVPPFVFSSVLLGHVVPLSIIANAIKILFPPPVATPISSLPLLLFVTNSSQVAATITTLHTAAERYQEPLVGPCRGPGGPLDKVNGRSAVEHTQGNCEAACDAVTDCTGYSYCGTCNGVECNLHGPGLDGACSDPRATSPVT